ncbi:MAG: 50S ribosomal protein L10 [Bacteroidales bacterium]|mgnify:FL=1|nr:50S ribosomal protein L10 [Bacteroidales bacterium]
MKKEVKDQVIESISALLSEYPNFYVTDIAGLDAKDTTKLRRACFENDIKLTVVKNTLFSLVVKRLENEEMSKILETLVGNTAIMYTQVPNAPGKLIKKLNKEGMAKPVLKSAYVQECAYVGADKLDQLAAIKTKNELIGDVIGLLQSPARRVIAALQNVAEGADEAAIIKALASAAAPAAEAPAEEAPAAE